MSRFRFNSRTRIAATAIAVTATIVLASCGSSDSSGDSSDGGDSSSAAASGDNGTPTLDELFKGTPGEPPTTGPAPAKGKTVTWVSCGSIAPDCAVPEAAAKEAAEKLGITFRSTDGNLNQAGGYLSAFRTAVAAKPDAIIAHALDCTSITPGIKEAKAAGIPVLGVEFANCPEITDMNYSEAIPNTEEWFKSWGRDAASYLIAKTDGKAQVILNEGTDAVFPLMNEGFVEQLKKCSGCKIVDTVKFTSAEIVPNAPWIQRFRTALTQNPTATATFIPSDLQLAVSGGGKAVQEANPKMLTVGGSGSSAGMGGLSSGLITADTFAHDPGWMGYASMDQINRLLQGEPIVPQGINTIVVDKDNNLPEAKDSAYVSSVDWKSAYEKIWADAS